VIDITSRGFELKELAPGVSVEDVQNATEGKLVVEGVVPIIQFKV
jgi:3-oxoacid CoA-transferase subunit B